MADNVTLSSGTGNGAVIGTDDVSGVHYQRVKVNFGVSGSASDVHAGNPLPVTVSGSVSISGNVTVTGDIDVSDREGRLLGSSHKDIIPSNGGVNVPIRFKKIEITASGNNTVVSGVTNSIIRVLSLAIVAATSGQTMKWKTLGSSGELSGDLSFAKNGGYTLANDYGLFQTATGESLAISLSTGGSVDGHISYILVTG